MQPDTSTTHLKQGQQLQREGRLTEAEVAYRQAIELNPIFYGSFRYLGEVLALQGKLDQAVEAYQRAKELNPKALWVHQGLGEVFLQLNKLGDAIACFQTALEINSDFSWAYNGLGECWSWKGNRENAIAAYQKAVELNSDSETFRHKLEKVLAEQELVSEEEITEKVEDSLELEKTPIEQKTIEEVIADWRRNGELNSQAANNSLLNSLEPISSFEIYPEQLAVRSGQLVEKGSRKQLISPTGNQGLVSFGPYINVPDGLYRVEVDFEFLDHFKNIEKIENSPSIGFQLDVVLNLVDGIFYEYVVKTDKEKITFFIDLLDAISLEIRFFARGIGFCINSIQLALLYEAMNFKSAAEYYFELGNALQQRGKYEKATAAYNKAVNLNPQKYLDPVISALKQLNDPYFFIKAHHNLAITLAQSGMLTEAITVFSQASKTNLIPGKIYQEVWLSLNHIGIFGSEISQSETEYNPEDTYSYFSKNSSYKISNLWNLSDFERDEIERSGLSINYLELIFKDDLALEEVYINSLAGHSLQGHPVHLSNKGGKHLRDNKSVYDIKKGRYFQHSLLETGYIYSVCPFTGMVLKSNHSFPIYAPYPGFNGSWHPIHIYRFVGAEVFYLICAVHPIGDKSFIYLPSRELIITSVPSHNCNLQESQIINLLKSCLISYWPSVKSYLASEQEKQVAVSLGWHYHIGHFIWNEMSGVHYLLENGTLNKVDKFLIGSGEYISYSDTYPEIKPEKIQRWEKPTDSWNLFKTIIDNNYVVLWPTDLVIKDDLGNRIYQGALKKCSAQVLEEVEQVKITHFPTIWIGIRGHYRVWSSQVEGIANIINSLHSAYPNLAVVFDGWGRHEHYDERAEQEIGKVNEVLEQIKTLVPAHLKLHSLIGAMTHERIIWAKAVNLYIAPHGSGMSIPVWVVNKPGVVHGTVGNNIDREKSAEWSSCIRENAVNAVFLPRCSNDSGANHPLRENYDIDWRIIYDEVVKLLNRLKAEEFVNQNQGNSVDGNKKSDTRETESLGETAEDLYKTIWDNLHHPTFDNLNSKNQDSSWEPQTEDILTFFTQTSKYKLLSLQSLSDEDRQYLNQLGITLANIELIAQDDFDLEQIYIKSFSDSPEDLLGKVLNFHPGGSHVQSLVETGYLYTVCPFDGKVLRSNQSFVINHQEGSEKQRGHDLQGLFYRFSGQQMFYLMLGCNAGEKLFIYFPKNDLIINLNSKLIDFARPIESVNKLKSYMVRYEKQVKFYLAHEKKQVANIVGLGFNLGHYIWQDLSALDILSGCERLYKIDKIIVGPGDYFSVRDVFSEIPSDNFIQVDDIEEAFKTIIEKNYVALKLYGIFMEDTLMKKVVQFATTKVSEDFCNTIEKTQQKFPLLGVHIRTTNRIWVGMVEGIANIIKKLHSNYPNLGIVFSGWSVTGKEDESNICWSIIDREKEKMEEIKALIPQTISTYSAIGNTIEETVVWAKAIDAHISPIGAELTFLSWIANKPGVVHGPTVAYWAQGVYASSTHRENLIPQVFLSKNYIVDKEDGLYECDWQAIYDEIFKIVNQLNPS